MVVAICQQLHVVTSVTAAIDGMSCELQGTVAGAMSSRINSTCEYTTDIQPRTRHVPAYFTHALIICDRAPYGFAAPGMGGITQLWHAGTAYTGETPFIYIGWRFRRRPC